MAKFKVDYTWFSDHEWYHEERSTIVEAEDAQQAFDQIDELNVTQCFGGEYHVDRIFYYSDEKLVKADKSLIDELNKNSHRLLQRKVYDLCKEHKTDTTGIDFLIKYYIDQLKWTPRQAYNYAIGLFNNGTIDEIKVIAGDNNDTD